MLSVAVWSLLVCGGGVGSDVGPAALTQFLAPVASKALQVSLLAAPEDAKKPKPEPPRKEADPLRKDPPPPKEKDELPGPFKFPPHIEMSAAQRANLVKLFEVFEPRRKELQESIDAVYTPEQRQALKVARDKAREAGLKGKEADAEVRASVALSAAQTEQIEKLHDESRELDETIRSAVLALLSREQKSQLTLGPGGKKEQPKKGPPPKPVAK